MLKFISMTRICLRLGIRVFKLCKHQTSYFCIRLVQAALDAYKIQNQFLNKEILELTQLRADDEAREKQLFM